jgi:hypothetical protein
MAGMPEMQEQFPASARDGGYAGNAGATGANSGRWPAQELKVHKQLSANPPGNLLAGLGTR